MDFLEKPKFSLGELAKITDELHDIDTDLWQVLRDFLMPIGIDDLPLAGPRPPRLTPKFYFVLSNYSIEAFRIEANLYRRYPPNPHYSKWLLDLAQRVENHAIDVVYDIESSSSKDFSYHRVSEEGMREAIWDALSQHMVDYYQAEIPAIARPPLPPQVQVQLDAKPMRTPTEDESDRGVERRAVVEPILVKKGWSVLDWANESDVAYHTADDYLKGKRTPYRSTIKKMAEPLGLSVHQLPR